MSKQTRYVMLSLLPAKFRIGNVAATVSLNGEQWTTVLSKSYKDDDQWKETDQLDHADLLNAIRCLERAEAFIADLT